MTTSQLHFDKLFRNPDPWRLSESFFEGQKYERQVNQIRDHKPDLSKILEIGCGEGFQTQILAQEFPEGQITAVDVSQIAIERARANLQFLGDRVSLACEDIASYAFKLGKNTFDVCVMSETLNFLVGTPAHYPLKKIYEMFDRIYDSLCEGGIIVLTNSVQRTPALRISMNSVYEMLASMGKVVSYSLYRGMKSEVTRTTPRTQIEYHIWVFRSKSLRNGGEQNGFLRLLLNKIKTNR